MAFHSKIYPLKVALTSPTIAQLSIELSEFYPGEVLLILNGTPCSWFVQECEEELQRHRQYVASDPNGGKLPKEWEEWERRERSRGPDISALDVPNKVATLLRRYVDEWIDSGRAPDGERPASRKLRPELAKELEPWLHTFPKMDVTTLRWHVQVRRYFPLGDRLDVQVFQYVGWLFASSLISGFAWRLCKCRYGPCGKYFQLEHDKAVWRHGTFCCIEHNKARSAAELTKASRDREKDQLIGFAAVAMLEWDPKKHKLKTKDEWVLYEVNRKRKRPKLKPLTKNWLSWNRAAIEAVIHLQSQTQIRADDPEHTPKLSKMLIA